MPFITSLKGSNENDLMLHNRSTLVKLLMKNGACSRAELARSMNLTQASISKIVNYLIDVGVVKESLPTKSNSGKRVIPVVLNSDGVHFLGIRITWKLLFIGVFSLNGNCSYCESINIDLHKETKHVIELICEKINDLVSKQPNIIAAGVSVPSPYIGKEGCILYVDSEGRDSFLSIAKEIRKNVHIPVYFKNDAKAGALAEWWFGNHDCNVLVHIAAGESIGSSIIVDTEPIVGSYGIAGEIGEMLVYDKDKRCYIKLNRCASSESFLNNFKMGIKEDSPWWNKRNISLEDIFKAVEEGDEYALKKVNCLGEHLGIAISNVITMLNPDVVVISDILIGFGNVLLDRIKAVAKDNLIPYVYDHVRIEFSTLSRNRQSESNNSIAIDTPVLGAVAVAIDMYLQNVTKHVTNVKR